MSDAFDMLAAIRDSNDAIRDALDPGQLAAFTRRSDQFGERARTIEGPEAEEELASEVLALVSEYPAVRHILQRDAPDTFESALESDRLNSATLESTKARQVDQKGPSSQVVPAGNSTVAPVTAIAAQGSGQPSADNIARSADGASRSSWGPELTLQALKESVAAIIGVVLIGVTAYLAVRTFERAGDQATVSDSKDVLQVMLGLAGVVLGYYFGRIPGDARAAQAQDQATVATAHAARVAAKGEELATRLDQTTVTRGAMSDEDTIAIQQLRAELRALAQARA